MLREIFEAQSPDIGNFDSMGSWLLEEIAKSVRQRIQKIG